MSETNPKTIIQGLISKAKIELERHIFIDHRHGGCVANCKQRNVIEDKIALLELELKQEQDN